MFTFAIWVLPKPTSLVIAEQDAPAKTVVKWGYTSNDTALYNAYRAAEDERIQMRHEFDSARQAKLVAERRAFNKLTPEQRAKLKKVAIMQDQWQNQMRWSQ